MNNTTLLKLIEFVNDFIVDDTKKIKINSSLEELITNKSNWGRIALGLRYAKTRTSVYSSSLYDEYKKSIYALYRGILDEALQSAFVKNISDEEVINLFSQTLNENRLYDKVQAALNRAEQLGFWVEAIYSFLSEAVNLRGFYALRAPHLAALSTEDPITGLRRWVNPLAEDLDVEGLDIYRLLYRRLMNAVCNRVNAHLEGIIDRDKFVPSISGAKAWERLVGLCAQGAYAWHDEPRELCYRYRAPGVDYDTAAHVTGRGWRTAILNRTVERQFRDENPVNDRGESLGQGYVNDVRGVGDTIAALEELKNTFLKTEELREELLPAIRHAELAMSTGFRLENNLGSTSAAKVEEDPELRRDLWVKADLVRLRVPEGFDPPAGMATSQFIGNDGNVVTMAEIGGLNNPLIEQLLDYKQINFNRNRRLRDDAADAAKFNKMLRDVNL